MTNPLVTKLKLFARLSGSDKAALAALTDAHVRRYRPGVDIVREGDVSRVVHVLLSGWAGRYKHLNDGRRQTLAVLLPGDFCDHGVLVGCPMDHSVGAFREVTVAEVEPAAFEGLIGARPHLVRAFRWEALSAAAMQREWALSLGRRSAIERLAHVFCELACRLRVLGSATTADGALPLPLTQEELADVIGMTSVHINRTLKQLHADGLIALRDRRLSILDEDGLRRVAQFDPSYLHLGGEAARLDARMG
ncbi:Crp/Fnr family transcriptional regulator [Methylobacterium sp. NEAU 140]|uniref:Crp/Fnr family transcriptional regulator n=1 Tax=Methylobacterium sp. NEAU 140 TaxID=3064945 RepID=UPI002735E770|nr:Crp/Fnr family transcriptional regulator [Methylobacterium sp. NEAU 140]MDP4026758.1 Crp/Fnr family transcriptional regulator [Methylobacterium sp. NEAU 140]